MMGVAYSHGLKVMMGVASSHGLRVIRINTLFNLLLVAPYS